MKSDYIKISGNTVPEHKHLHIHQMIPQYIEDLQWRHMKQRQLVQLILHRKRRGMAQKWNCRLCLLRNVRNRDLSTDMASSCSAKGWDLSEFLPEYRMPLVTNLQDPVRRVWESALEPAQAHPNPYEISKKNSVKDTYIKMVLSLLVIWTIWLLDSFQFSTSSPICLTRLSGASYLNVVLT